MSTFRSSSPLSGLPSSLELEEAIRAARGSMTHFLNAFRNPEPHQTGFQLRVAFEVDNSVEHVWLSAIEQLEGHVPTGIIVTKTRLAGFVPGLRVPFEEVRVTDWMYTDDNELVGGFTARAVLKLKVRAAARLQQEARSASAIQ